MIEIADIPEDQIIGGVVESDEEYSNNNVSDNIRNLLVKRVSIDSNNSNDSIDSSNSNSEP